MPDLATYLRRLHCAGCETSSFKVTEDGGMLTLECVGCGAIVAEVFPRHLSTHANGVWIKERAL